eukprot:c33059_g1_i1 orf=102-656(+)
MAVASLPFARLSLLQSSPSTSSSCNPNTCSLRLASSQSFAITPLAHVACRGFSVSGGVRRRSSVIVAAAATPTKKKADSAVKRARQAEKNRIYNKARKSEITTRMKKVFVAIEGLKKQQTSASEEMLPPIESLISEAFSTIDKAVQVGTLHRNTGARRKSRLSRAKKTLEVQMGWYTPSPTPAP